MKIQIVGLGVVGTAQAYMAKEMKHEVVGYDPNIKDHTYCKVNDYYIKDADITFICTPETVVEETIENMTKIGHEGIIVIKSTVPLGLTEQLSEKFNVHICHNPEFLRGTCAINDVMNPSRIVIGECCHQHGEVLRNFYEGINAPIHMTNSRTSEVIKLVSNSFRVITITFWNEISLLCNAMDVDVKKVSEINDSSKLIGDWEGGSWGTKYFGVPYGGKCLPKDIRHLISAFRVCGYNPKIFDACEEFNNWLMIRDKK